MGRHGKSGRPHLFHVTGAAVDVEHLVAFVTLKVMMVFQIGQFVSSGRARDLNDFESSALHQALEISIDGGYPDSGDRFRGDITNLVR